ncbi:MAG: hypothetical protein U1E70_14390 [Acetobacteraceae bacterium]
MAAPTEPRDQANDPVLGLTWLDRGLDNIVYLDIDAHHGDGVQDAFHGDDRVFTISLHGQLLVAHRCRRRYRRRHRANSFRYRPAATTAIALHVIRHAVLPLIERRRPLQAGYADSLHEDPLASSPFQQRLPRRRAGREAPRPAPSRARRWWL